MSDLEGKVILLIYEGLDCMYDFRLTLNDIYANSSRDELEIVLFCEHYKTPEELRELREEFPCEFVIVSDFRGAESPVKAIYSGNETPHSAIIAPDGTVGEGMYTSAGLMTLLKLAGWPEHEIYGISK